MVLWFNNNKNTVKLLTKKTSISNTDTDALLIGFNEHFLFSRYIYIIYCIYTILYTIQFSQQLLDSKEVV